MEEIENCNSSNFHSVCRTCLENLSYQQHDIFQIPDLKKKLVVCTSLTVEPGDGYPSSMCQSCFLKLCDFYEFQQMCICSMQRCHELIATERKQFTIGLDIEKDQLAEHLLILKEAKKEPEEDTIFDEIEELIDLEPSTPKTVEETQFQLLTTTKRAKEEVSSSEEDSDNDPDYECQGSEDNSNDAETESNKHDNDEGDNTNCLVEEPNHENPSKPNKMTFVCEICSRRFVKEAMLAAHKRIHEGLTSFPCAECNKSFAKLRRLRNHIRAVHERKEAERLPCPEPGCPRTYALQQTLAKHLKDSHNRAGEHKPPMFICEDCGKVLTSMATLKNHRYIHTGQELPFECAECHKRYITSHKLKVHMNRHLGIKNYVCPHCGARKTTRTELNVHVNYHTKEKQYPCKYCDQIFNSVGNMSRHVRIVHEGIKAYPCKYCSQSFGKAETRKHHEMTHTGEKPHVCKICQKSFIQSVSLHKHMQRHYKATGIISTALGKSSTQ